LAKLSHHPLSKSIFNNNKESLININSSEEKKWKWIIWNFDWKIHFLWNKKIFSDKLISPDIIKLLDWLTSEWKTPVIFWNTEEILTIYWLLDLPKQWVENVIKQLHDMNIQTCMLTWDTEKTAKYIAQNIGITDVIAEVMPADKLEIIKKYQWEWKKVAFVWDGINDAPALTQADLSIAMWTWSDIAIESADIVLVWWNIEKVQTAICLSRKTLTIIKQNLFWAFLYNSIWIPLAALGLLNPIFASFAMSMSSVSVIMNSLRLKK
jgi:Cu+-exporting ATPase